MFDELLFVAASAVAAAPSAKIALLVGLAERLGPLVVVALVDVAAAYAAARMPYSWSSPHGVHVKIIGKGLGFGRLP